MRIAFMFAVLFATASTSTSASPLHVERLVFDAGPKSAQPAVAVDPQGFVVTWQQRDGADSVLRFAEIADDGRELRRGVVSRGPDRFVNGADFPQLVVLDNGDWVTYWLQKSAPDTYAYDIRLVRSRDRGATWDAATLLNRDGTTTEHGFVSLVPAGGDRVRAVWLDGRRMAGAAHAHGEEAAEHMTLRTALVDRSGAPSDERELDDLTCACCQTDAVRVGAHTLAVYRDRTDANVRDIGWLAHADDAWSAPRIVHADGWTIAGCPVNGPALAAQAARVAVVWPTMADGEMALFTALGDAEGFGAPVLLGRGAHELGRLDAAAWTDGGWLATRMVTEAGSPSLRVSMLSAEGAETGTQLVAGRVGGFPRIAARGDVALLAWAEGESSASRVAVARITNAPPRAVEQGAAAR